MVHTQLEGVGVGVGSGDADGLASGLGVGIVVGDELALGIGVGKGVGDGSSVGRGEGPGCGVGLGLACGWVARKADSSGPPITRPIPIHTIARQRVTSETNVAVPFFMRFPLDSTQSSLRFDLSGRDTFSL